MALRVVENFSVAPTTGASVGATDGVATWATWGAADATLAVTPSVATPDIDVEVQINLAQPAGHAAGSAVLRLDPMGEVRTEWAAGDPRAVAILRIEHRRNGASRAFVNGAEATLAGFIGSGTGGVIGTAGYEFRVSVSIFDGATDARAITTAELTSLVVSDAALGLTGAGGGGTGYLARDTFATGSVSTGRTVETQTGATATWTNQPGLYDSSATLVSTTSYSGGFNTTLIPPGIALNVAGGGFGSYRGAKFTLSAAPATTPSVAPDTIVYATATVTPDVPWDPDGSWSIRATIRNAAGIISSTSVVHPGAETYVVRAEIVGGVRTWYVNGAPTGSAAFAGDAVITQLNVEVVYTNIVTAQATLTNMEIGLSSGVAYTPTSRFWTSLNNTSEAATHTLSKLDAPTVIPGVAGTMGDPGRPGVPAYTSNEVVNVCGFNPIVSTLHVATTTDAFGARTIDAGALSYAGASIYQTQYSCHTETITTFHPAVAAIPPTPGTPATPEQVLAAAPSWNASARSVQGIPSVSGSDQYFEFGIPGDPGGVLISLIADPLAPAATELDVLFEAGSVKINGATVGSLSSFTAGVFALVLNGTSASLYFGDPGDGSSGTLVGSATVPLDTYFVLAQLYASTDSVIYPRLDLISAGAEATDGGYTGLSTAAVAYFETRVLPQFGYLAVGSGGGVDSISWPSLQASATSPYAKLATYTAAFGGSSGATVYTGTGPGDSPTVSDVVRNFGALNAVYFVPLEPLAVYLMPLEVRGGSGPSNGGRLSFVTLFVQGGEEVLPVPSTGVAPLGLLSVSGLGTTGGVGQASLVLAGMDLIGGRPYAVAELSLAPMELFATNYEGPDVASIGGLGFGLDNLTSEVLLIVEMTSTGELTSVFAATLLWDADAVSTATAENTTTADQLLDALLVSYASASGVDSQARANTETWVVNLDSQASTRYTGYDFNSFARIGGKYYGARQDGLYLLDGDTDAGTPILGRVQLGRTDMNAPVLKRLEAVYAAISSTGTMYLKVTDQDGVTHTYSARRSSSKLEQQRIDVGRGIVANFLTFELLGNGADFEVSGLEFNAVTLTRRIR